jgi:hypothetical protein
MNTKANTHQNATQWDEKTRRALFATGVLFILTFVTSIPALFFYAPVLDHPDYVLGSGHDLRVSIGVLLEIGLVICNAGTAITLYPIARRFTETLAIGYVASRLFESAMIAVGVVSILGVLALRQDFGGTESESFVAAARSLLAIHDGTFLLGPAFCAAFGNGILLGSIMFKSGLMPRRVAMLGLIGGPLAFVTAVAVVLGAWDQMSPIGFLFTLPEIVWESTFGIFLTVKAIKLGRAAHRDSAPMSEPVGREAGATAAS